MNFLQIYRLLRRHLQLSERRNPAFESNKAARWLLLTVYVMVAVYLIGFAVLLSMIANDTRRYTALEFFIGCTPFILTLDFYMRFLLQQTPTQLIKPYVLLPLPRYACIDTFVLNSLLSSGNLVWMLLAVPYCLMSVVFGYGLLAALMLLVAVWLMALCSSQCYSICRTLIANHAAWLLLPLAATAAMVAAYCMDGTHIFRWVARQGDGMEHGRPWLHLALIAALAVLVAVNRRMQYANVMKELMRVKDTKARMVLNLSFLERFNTIGAYLKLEVNMALRNKNPRKSYISALCVTVMMTLLITLTDVYDTHFMTNFWCIYSYVIFPQVVLTKVMCYEGNYIHFLMVHHENILSLLTAKYYFNCALLVVPFCLMLPMVFVGKWSIAMLLAYGLFTAGFQLAMLLQMAVYNNTTMPLNEKFMGKGGMENSYVQILLSFAVFIVPITLVQMLEAVFPVRVAWSVMAAIGLAGLATHRLWLRNIYRRMMARKYKNMEAFHA